MRIDSPCRVVLPEEPEMWERISGVLLAMVVIAALVLLVGVLALVRRWVG